jgi:hypothetical protein
LNYRWASVNGYIPDSRQRCEASSRKLKMFLIPSNNSWKE